MADDGFGPEAMVELFRSLLSEQAAERRIFETMLSDVPLGIPHSVPPTDRRRARTPRKRAKE
jgi:hypothetical protein